jgi:hypothetical protein
LLSQFLVFKVVGIDEAEQCIAEQERVVPVVESELEFVKVTVKMFSGNLTIRANDGTLEKRPRIFSATGCQAKP